MDFEEITTSIRGPGVSENDWNDEFCGCECEFECSSESNCTCLIQNKENYTNNGQLKCDPVGNDNRLILECHDQCNCSLLPKKCNNRVVQNGIIKQLKVIKTQNKGFGVKCDESILEGEFICEYAGECIGEEEVRRRFEIYKNEDNYTFTVKEYYDNNIQKSFIDPRLKGNIGKFLNHSCDPNCRIIIVRIGRNIPSVAIFAKRNIKAGEELCYSYGDVSMTLGDNRKLCLCGAENCKKYLPMSISPID